MALHKAINNCLAPLAFCHANKQHCLQQCKTFISGSRSGLLKDWCRTLKIKHGLIIRRNYHQFSNTRHVMESPEQLVTNKTPLMSSRTASTMTSQFKNNLHLSSTSRYSSSHQLCSKSHRFVRRLHSMPNKLFYGKITHTCNTPVCGDIVRRHRHTGVDSDSNDTRYKELPVLFKHKTKLKKAGGRSAIGAADLAEMKRRIKKKPAGVVAKQDMLMCSAYATAESYYLEELKRTLIRSGKYSPVELPQDADDVLYMHVVNDATQDSSQDERTEIVFFEEGTVVFWNATQAVENDVLWILEYHQRSPYPDDTVQEENEQINYMHKEVDTYVTNKGVITLDTRNPQNVPLEKFAISNAISHSVKLAMWENSLEDFTDSIEYIPDYMSLGKPISMSREEVMKKRGKLFALRHRINLSSDLLIASDFYWDRDNLETLYQKMCSFYSIGRRTKVMNERLNHCSELVELMRLHLSEKHSTRLEWMIIILIAVEVLFETIHYIKTYFFAEEITKNDSSNNNSLVIPLTPAFSAGPDPVPHNASGTNPKSQP